MDNKSKNILYSFGFVVITILFGLLLSFALISIFKSEKQLSVKNQGKVYNGFVGSLSLMGIGTELEITCGTMGYYPKAKQFDGSSQILVISCDKGEPQK